MKLHEGGTSLLWRLWCKNRTHLLGYVIKTANFPSRWIARLRLSSPRSGDGIMEGLDLSQHQWCTVDGCEVPLPVSECLITWLERMLGNAFELTWKEKLEEIRKTTSRLITKRDVFNQTWTSPRTGSLRLITVPAVSSCLITAWKHEKKGWVQVKWPIFMFSSVWCFCASGFDWSHKGGGWENCCMKHWCCAGGQKRNICLGGGGGVRKATCVDY